MFTKTLALSTALTALSIAQTTAPTTLEKRYTPPSSSCGYICKDYLDDCGNTYGPGCFTSCSGSADPTFTTPICEATTTPALFAKPGPTTTLVIDGVMEITTRVARTPTTTTTSCGYICKDYFDDCGNTYGPGCFTSCAEQADPTFSTPVCTAAAATAAATTTTTTTTTGL